MMRPTEEHCRRCNKKTTHEGMDCLVCRREKAESAKREHIAFLEAMPLESRIARLEQLYYHDSIARQGRPIDHYIK
jgi:hypothetical protein